MPFPPTAERFEILEEALQVCFQMWSDDDGPFTSKHFQLAETICNPHPISTPRPPVLIGGSGERKTLRLVAKYADACNLFAPSPTRSRTSSTCCAATATPKAATTTRSRRRCCRGAIPSDVDAVVDEMRVFAKLGIDTVIFVPSGDPVAFTQRLGGDLAGAPRRSLR